MGIECPKCKTENTSDSEFCKKCATPLPSSKEILVTETLETPKEELTTGSLFAGRYQIIEVLGKGGMGKVYRALDKKLNEEVALKLIKPEIASDKKTLERFNNELKFARKITHKNVGRMYELMEEKGTHFITMEYVPGQDLRGLIRQSGQLAVGTAISIAKQVSEGLTEAHRLGVIHRDLKPQNIMIDKEGNARIMDFGIARSVSGKGITGAGVMVGTPEYMSPEQVESKETDQRSDIYSLGVILYEMVTGRVPFEGDTPLSVAVKHKTETPPDPKEINTQIPEDLSRLILRCMEKSKEKRYQSAGEARSELENIEKGIPITEKVIPKRKPITSKEITVTFGLKKLFIPALAVIALVIVALIILQILPKEKAAPIPSDKPFLAVLYFENNTGDENLDNWKQGLSNSIITDLSQSKYISVLGRDRLLSILRKINKQDSTDYATEDLNAIATESGVNYILTGILSKAGDTFRIEYTLHDIQREEISGLDRVEGQGEDNLFAMVDELTLKVKKNFNLSETQLADDVDRELWRISTAKPEAYKYYIEALQLENLGNYRQTISIVKKAIEIDPEFAMAYRLLGAVNANLGNIREREINLTKAFELRDRVPEIEKRWITADYIKLVERDFEKAVDAYNSLFELAPNHTIGHLNLAGLYNSHGYTDEAIKHFEMSRQNFMQFFPLSQWLGDAYEEKGMYEKAREVYQDYLDNIQALAIIHGNIASTYVYEGKYEEALKEADKALSLDPTSYAKSGIYHLQGDFEAAEKGYKRWLEVDNNNWKFNGRRWLEILYRNLGQYVKAQEQAEKGLELAEEVGNNSWKRGFHIALGFNHWSAGNYEEAMNEAEQLWASAAEDQAQGSMRNSLFLKTLIYLEQGQIDKAQTATEEMKKIIEGMTNPKLIRDYYFLRGMIELKRNDYFKAVDDIERCYSMFPKQRDWIEAHAFYVYYFGLAHFLSGNLDKAEEAYDDIINMTTGRLWWGDLWAKSFYMLGKIHEQQSNTAKAIEHYEKFLDLWKDSDPGITEVEDARKRLAGLKRQ